jgi:hypothetical protein
MRTDRRVTADPPSPFSSSFLFQQPLQTSPLFQRYSYRSLFHSGRESDQGVDELNKGRAGVMVGDAALLEFSDIAFMNRFENHVLEGELDLVMKSESGLISHVLTVLLDDHGACAANSMHWMDPRTNWRVIGDTSNGMVFVGRQNGAEMSVAATTAMGRGGHSVSVDLVLGCAESSVGGNFRFGANERQLGVGKLKLGSRGSHGEEEMTEGREMAERQMTER